MERTKPHQQALCDCAQQVAHGGQPLHDRRNRQAVHGQCAGSVVVPAQTKDTVLDDLWERWDATEIKEYSAHTAQSAVPTQRGCGMTGRDPHVLGKFNTPPPSLISLIYTQ